MQYTSQVNWKRHTPTFDAKSYDRTHEIQFGGGTSISGSSAPEFLGRQDLPNPEELFAASLGSCFMLTFLYWAALKGLVIDEYRSVATGILGKNSDGKMAMLEVIIKPTIILQNNVEPDPAVLAELFKKAHDNCFISNSVKTTVRVEMA